MSPFAMQPLAVPAPAAPASGDTQSWPTLGDSKEVARKKKAPSDAGSGGSSSGGRVSGAAVLRSVGSWCRRLVLLRRTCGAPVAG